MKKITALVLSLALIFSLVVLPSAINTSAEAPYVNKVDFEAGLPTGSCEVSGYDTSVAGSYSGGLTTAKAHSGSKAYEMKTWDTAWKTTFVPIGNVESGKSYLVDLYYYVDLSATIYGSGHSGTMSITASTASPENYWSGTTAQGDILEHMQCWQLVHQTATKGWRHVSGQFTATATNGLYVSINAKDAIAMDIIIDDITVTEVTEDSVVVNCNNVYNYYYDQAGGVKIAGVAGTPITYVPERPGYKFGGWYAEPELTTPVTAFSASATSLYPAWIVSYSEDFESSNAVPANSHAYYSFNTNPANAHSGSKSIKLDSNAIAWSLYGMPLCKVEAGSKYAMDFWYRLDNVGGANMLFVPIFASEGNIWGANKYPFEGDIVTASFQDNNIIQHYFVVPTASATGVWVHSTMIFTVPTSVGTNNMLWLNVMGLTTGCSMTAYIDDISVNKLTENSAVTTFMNTYEGKNNGPVALAGKAGEDIDYVPVREGYGFKGFYTAKEGGEKVTKWTNNATVYARWGLDDGSCLVTFDANGGILKGTATEVVKEGNFVTTPNPVRPLYDFIGWYSPSGDPVTEITESCTLVAHWSETISFESFYRSRANNLGYALHIVDEETAPTGKKVAFFEYGSANWDCPVCTPVFLKPADWSTSYKNYLYFDDISYPQYLVGEAVAPDFVPGEFYYYAPLTEEPADWSTAYSEYGTFKDNKIVLLTEPTAFASGKFYKTLYSDIDGMSAFANVGNVFDGKKYEVTFKYSAASADSNGIKIGVFNYPIYSTTYSNAVKYTEDEFVVDAANCDGNWYDGKITFTADAKIVDGFTSDTLGLYVSLTEKGKEAIVMIDDVTVTEVPPEAPDFLYGDVTGEGDVDAVDLTRLKKYLAGQKVDIAKGADTNNDTSVDAVDLTRLKKHLAGSIDLNEGSSAVINVLAGKKWSVVGDSITDSRNSAASKRYYNYVAEDTGCVATMYGVSGSGYWSGNGGTQQFYNRIAQLPTDTEIVTVLGSVNDFSATLGQIDDTSKSTIAGCVNATISAIRSRCPNAKILIISPLPAGGSFSPWIEDSTNKGHMYTLLLKSICEKEGLAFLDLYHNCILEPYDGAFNKSYYSNGDGTHPNDYGHSMIYKQIEEALYSLYAE